MVASCALPKGSRSGTGLANSSRLRKCLPRSLRDLEWVPVGQRVLLRTSCTEGVAGGVYVAHFEARELLRTLTASLRPVRARPPVHRADLRFLCLCLRPRNHRHRSDLAVVSRCL